MIKRLVSDLQDERVTIITGTGLSVAATQNQEVEGYRVATWAGLLLHGVEHCREIGIADDFDVDILTRQINSGRTDYLILAAEAISSRMRDRAPGVLRGWLKNSVGALKVADHSVVEAISVLPGVLATLNYDSIIEDVTGRRTITWLQSDEVEEVLNGRYDDTVLHLHGWYREPESVVLGSTSYLSVKEHPHAKAVLQHFTIGRTLLFIGCGATFEDPNFAQLIRWAKEAIADVSPRHFVLCRTSEIGNLQADLASAPWLQPLSYGDAYEDLAPFLRSLATAKRPAKNKLSARPPLDIEAYRKATLARYRRLKIEQIDTTTHDIRPLTLNAMYIPQHAKECTAIIPRVLELPKELQHQLRRKGELEGAELDDSTLAQYSRAYLEGSPRLISDILNDTSCSNIVILGDPGSGKSTLLQHVLLQWAEGSGKGNSAAPLPLLIELREFARFAKQKESDNFLGYLHEGTGVRWHLDAEALTTWLRAQHSLVLFDGLDEIFDLGQRKEITTAIHRFAHEFPLARVIVTSRVVGYQHQAWNDEGFRQFMLQDLDEEQIRTFLQRWHSAAYEDPVNGENKRLLLERAISDSSSIRQLAGNPLLLTMMAVLNRTQDLPRDRAELYEQCARLLLHQWKIEVAFQTDPDLANASLDFKDKRGLLLRVAREMHSGGRGLAGNLIDEETLESTLAAGLNEIRVSLPARAARSLIDQLRGRNFMLCFMGGHSYAFVHRTFLEYFCAAEIRERFEKERSLTLDQLKVDIYGHWRDETWHEVLCLLAGMISAKFVEQVIQWLMRQPDPNNTHHNIFIALRCLSEVRNRSGTAETESALRSLSKNLSLFEPPFPTRPWTPEGEAASDVRERALKMMALVWPDSSDNSKWFKQVALSASTWDECELAVRLLVQGWREDSETLIWLKEQARSKGKNRVRPFALKELGRNWPRDPEVQIIAESAFRDDVDESTRSAAVEVRVMLRPNDPALLDTLINTVKNDGSFYVSYYVLQVILENWPNDPMVFSTVLSMARADDGRLQHIALPALVQHWKDAPETAALLQDVLRYKNRLRNLGFSLALILWDTHKNPTILSIAKEVARSKNDDHSRMHAIDVLVSDCRNDSETLPIVMSCAKDTRAAQVRLHAIRQLFHWPEEAGVFEFLKNLTSSRYSVIVRDAALWGLDHGWGKVAEIKSLFLEIARKDGPVELRKTAIEALVRSGIGNENVLELLKTLAGDANVAAEVRVRALKAMSSFVNEGHDIYSVMLNALEAKQATEIRLEALRLIVLYFADRPQTLPLLKHIALTDKNADVRLPAVAEIGRRGNEDLDALGALKKIIRKDRSKLVRLRAVRELARGWPRDTEVAQLIAQCEKTDASRDVRDAASEELARLRTES